jgi:acyl-CoA synthetase (AMP-forming)/AMP-acid ligase II
MSLVDLLHTTASRHGHRPAVTDVRSGRSLSYGDLAREAGRVAAFLRAEGLEAGQRIGLLAPNGPAYLPAAFGLLEAGACLVPLATTLAPAEMAQVVSEVDVNGCLAWPGAAFRPGEGRPPALTGGACDGFTFQWIDRGAAAPEGFHRLDPAFIRFTSGTTARCKGVVLSHAATVARVTGADRVLAFSEEDRVLWVLPLAYHFAVTIVAYVRAGAHILLCPDTLPGALVEAARQTRPTVLYASPLQFERMGQLPPAGPLASVRLALSTSAPITVDVMDRFRSVHGVPVDQAYGIIECGLPCINLPGHGLPPASVGRPVPGYEIAVFSGEGERVPPDVPGEVGVRGSGLFSTYYAPWTPLDRATRDGWFLTGDVGRIGHDGGLRLEGRTKAVIFVAGFKFSRRRSRSASTGSPGSGSPG